MAVITKLPRFVPDTEVRPGISDVIQEVLNLDRDNLPDLSCYELSRLGTDSIDLAEIGLGLERKFDLSDIGRVLESDSVESLSQRVETELFETRRLYPVGTLYSSDGMILPPEEMPPQYGYRFDGDTVAVILVSVLRSDPQVSVEAAKDFIAANSDLRLERLLDPHSLVALPFDIIKECELLRNVRVQLGNGDPDSEPVGFKSGITVRELYWRLWKELMRPVEKDYVIVV